MYNLKPVTKKLMFISRGAKPVKGFETNHELVDFLLRYKSDRPLFFRWKKRK